jgi:hypothetical protein
VAGGGCYAEGLPEVPANDDASTETEPATAL